MNLSLLVEMEIAFLIIMGVVILAIIIGIDIGKIIEKEKARRKK